MDKTIKLSTLKAIAENVTAYTRLVEPESPFVIYIDKFVRHIEILFNNECEWESELKDEELDEWERRIESSLEI